jgi:hypothetical protein
MDDMYQYSPGILTNILARRKAEARQAMLDDLERRQVEGNLEVQKENMENNRIWRQGQADAAKALEGERWMRGRPMGQKLSPEDLEFMKSHNLSGYDKPQTIHHTKWTEQPTNFDDGGEPHGFETVPADETTEETVHTWGGNYDQQEEARQQALLQQMMTSPDFLELDPLQQSLLLGQAGVKMTPDQLRGPADKNSPLYIEYKDSGFPGSMQDYMKWKANLRPRGTGGGGGGNYNWQYYEKVGPNGERIPTMVNPRPSRGPDGRPTFDSVDLSDPTLHRPGGLKPPVPVFDKGQAHNYANLMANPTARRDVAKRRVEGLALVQGAQLPDSVKDIGYRILNSMDERGASGYDKYTAEQIVQAAGLSPEEARQAVYVVDFLKGNRPPEE